SAYGPARSRAPSSSTIWRRASRSSEYPMCASQRTEGFALESATFKRPFFHFSWEFPRMRRWFSVLLVLFAVPALSAVPIPKAPTIDARAYILMDYESGKVLGEEKADERMEPASLTKLMTAYAVFKALKENRLKLDDMVPISEHAWKAEGSRTFVQLGPPVPAEVLIKGMIIQSGNDATIALAERVGGSEPAFVQLMNEYSKRLGMKNTNWADSSGLPNPNHYT